MLVVVCLPTLLIIVAFAVQLTYLDLARIELRTVTDGAAEAAARMLSHTGDTAQAIAMGKQVAARNTVCGIPCVLEDSDFEFGAAVRSTAGGRFEFSPGGNTLNGVRVNASVQVARILSTFGFSAAVKASAVAGQIDRDIALVLDRSTSMIEPVAEGWNSGDPAPASCRWTELANSALGFLVALQDDTPMLELVSLTTYDQDPVIDSELSANYTEHVLSINDYTASFPGGSTNIGDAIDFARRTLRENGFDRSWAAKTIVIMTDGNHNEGTLSPADAATLAASQGVTIHTITYGNDANQATMANVASIGGGSHWHAPDSAALAQAFREIAASQPTMLLE